MNEGDRLKAEGVEKISGVPQGAPWRAVAEARLLELCASGRAFTSEDITATVGQPGHPNQVGALLVGATKRGWIERVGYIKADRPNQHSAMISQWEGTSAGQIAYVARRSYGVNAAIHGTVTASHVDDDGVRVVDAVKLERVDMVSSPAWTPGVGWRCQSCATISSIEPGTKTLADDIQIGPCPTCGKRRAHRRVT